MSNFTKLLLIPMFLLLLSPLATAEGFVDVNVGDKYYVAINALKEAGVIEGYSDNTFKQYQDINRAEALKMILVASGAVSMDQLEPPDENPFADVSKTDWFAPYTEIAKEKGIISGKIDGRFQADMIVNLAEALKILLEASDEEKEYQVLPDYLYTDTYEASWYTKYTSEAASKGIINIYPSNTVNPTQEMTRGYTAEIIYRLMKSKEGFDFGKATYYGAAVQGNGTASGDIFDYNLMTAAHKTLPFGTIVRVTNMANGKSVDVKINDRGPYGPGRVIDLSSGAFKQIASLGAGVITVQYQVISSP